MRVGLPVAHDDAVEAPFVAEDALQELGVLGAVHAPNTSIPCHGMRMLWLLKFQKSHEVMKAQGFALFCASMNLSSIGRMVIT